MNKKFFIALTCTIFLFASLGTLTYAKTGKYVPTKAYKDKNSGYQIRYPKNFNNVSYGTSGFPQVNILCKDCELGNFENHPRIEIIVDENPLKLSALDWAKANPIDSNFLTGEKETKYKNIKAGKQNAIRYSWNKDTEAGDSVIFTKGNLVFSLSAIYFDGADPIRKDFKKIISSFRFVTKKKIGPADWKTYENTEYGFTFQQPPDMYHDKTVSYKGYWDFRSEKENITLNIYIQDVTATESDEWLIANETPTGMLGGEKAYVSDGGLDPAAIYTAIYSGKLYTLSFYGDRNLSESEKTILDSFTFTPQ